MRDLGGPSSLRSRGQITDVGAPSFNRQRVTLEGGVMAYDGNWNRIISVAVLYFGQEFTEAVVEIDS